MNSKYTLCSVVVTIIVLLLLWMWYHDWRQEMIGEPFVSGIYDASKSSNWVYFPLFGQRMSRSGCVYYNNPFQLNLREYKTYPDINIEMQKSMNELITATKNAAVPVPPLPVKPVPASAPSPEVLTKNNPVVPDTGKKAIVTVPTANGNKQIVAPVVPTNGEDKAIVSLPTKNGDANLAVPVPSKN